MDEPIHDEELLKHIAGAMASRDWHDAAQSVRMPFGRRLGWYAVARAIKLRLIVETGVERGHGSVLLCSALKRNAAEGHPGRYYGTDINPNAGALLGGVYKEFGEILYGDSIESLKTLSGPLDVFINDSDHSAEYEGREYEIVSDKLSSNAIVLGDNVHVTDELAKFAAKTGWKFILFKEVPNAALVSRRRYWHSVQVSGPAGSKPLGS